MRLHVLLSFIIVGTTFARYARGIPTGIPTDTLYPATAIPRSIDDPYLGETGSIEESFESDSGTPYVRDLGYWYDSSQSSEADSPEEGNNKSSREELWQVSPFSNEGYYDNKSREEEDRTAIAINDKGILARISDIVKKFFFTIFNYIKGALCKIKAIYGAFYKLFGGIIRQVWGIIFFVMNINLGVIKWPYHVLVNIFKIFMSIILYFLK